eukprot:5322157-Alexandrium_andersonii.AAC.1
MAHAWWGAELHIQAAKLHMRTSADPNTFSRAPSIKAARGRDRRCGTPGGRSGRGAARPAGG